MPKIKPVNTIETTIPDSIPVDPLIDDSVDETFTPQITFPQLLDYTFPGDLGESPVIEIGEITYVGDGICHISGLNQAKIDEVIDIKTLKGFRKALVLGLQENLIEAVVLGDYSVIKRGDQARSTGFKLRVPVGEGLLGRVINPLGDPIDGLGQISADGYRSVEFPAPGVVDRIPITQPLHTGILAIDSTIPIGRGQRELVIGDRKTGKSRTMIDIICNQKNTNTACIYVGIGIQAAKAKSIVQILKSKDALKFTSIVVATSDDPPPYQYLAPYVGAALSEHYMYQGKNALVVYDDLSKQAKAYRQISLLLKRSPGRDAYPGDIFFLHSRLLERASQLNSKLGGGSVTALPVAETQSGDISDYIITNLMSITDGHIYLDANMMHEGLLPAINSGASVSRIGGKVQTPLLRKVGELASRILARYNEVRSFETINTEVSEDTLRDIKRGKRIRETFSQTSDLNLTAEEEVILLAIATSSRMDHFELPEVITTKTKLIPFYREQKPLNLINKINTAKDLKTIDPDLDLFFTQFCQKYQLKLTQ